MLQRGMYFRAAQSHSVVLMSVRANAPYMDRIENGGQTIVYEGHDQVKSAACPTPKLIDQPEYLRSGSLTENGRFLRAAIDFKTGNQDLRRVRVYEKLQAGLWSYAGVFGLTDGWRELQGARHVFKFQLDFLPEETPNTPASIESGHSRVIPTAVKIAVFRRDQGRCVMCGATTELHFDHILPFSKGGTSILPENVQLLCARHNLEKHDHIR